MEIKIDNKRKIVKQRLNKNTVRVKIPLIIDWSKNWFQIIRDLDIWWERYTTLKHCFYYRNDIYTHLDSIDWWWFLNDLLLEAKEVYNYKND